VIALATRDSRSGKLQVGRYDERAAALPAATGPDERTVAETIVSLGLVRMTKPFVPGRDGGVAV
jgi:hypothetical protein